MSIEEKRYKPEFSLHKAGGVYGDLVIEPLRNFNYLWKKGENRGISPAIYDKENKCWTLEILGDVYFFADKPLDKIIFRVPNPEKIKVYISGSLKSKTSQEIVQMIKRGLKTFLDFPQEYYYDIATLIILESWAIEKLNTVFYVAVVGGFGGGKTVTLEVLKSMCRHGCLSGSITAAGSSRIIEEQKLSVFYDELDVKDNTDDNQLYMSIRQGYRRNNKYIRLKAKTYEPESFDSFGVKGFSLHSDIERATKTRAFTINIGETIDNRLSILNLKKDDILNEIHNDIFFWYMDHIADTSLDMESCPAVDLSQSVEGIRKSLYQSAVSCLSAKEIDFLNKFRGRNIELGYIALQISLIFGVDFLDGLEKSFEEKQELESEFDESSLLSMLKDTLVDYLPQDYVEQQKIYQDFNSKLEQIRLKAMSPHKFKAMLREFGFIDGINRKKKKIKGETNDKSVYHLFFDERVRSRLVSHVSQVSQDSGFLTVENNESLLPYYGNNETQETTETQETQEPKPCDICKTVYPIQSLIKKTLRDSVTGRLEEAALCIDCRK